MEYHTTLMTVNERMILLVEDDPDHEALTIRALKKANIANNIRVAHDGEEAIEMLFGQGEKVLPYAPQVILLDLKLPKIDGLEVLRRIRESEQHHMLPVVVLTSSDEESDLMRSYKLGVNSYIRKPVNFTDFAEATRQLGMYWLGRDEAPPPALSSGMTMDFHFHRPAGQCARTRRDRRPFPMGATNSDGSDLSDRPE